MLHFDTPSNPACCRCLEKLSRRWRLDPAVQIFLQSWRCEICRVGICQNLNPRQPAQMHFCVLDQQPSFWGRVSGYIWIYLDSFWPISAGVRTCGEAIVRQWDVQVASPEEVNRGREVLNESSKLEVHLSPLLMEEWWKHWIHVYCIHCWLMSV